MVVEDTKKKTIPMGKVSKGIRGFILGGKSEFTISQKDNIKYKYEVVSNKEGNLWFVYMNKKYQGYIRNTYSGYSFFVGNKGNKSYDTNAINGLLWVLNRGDNIPEEVQVLHHGKCSVCGRPLSDAESLAWGVGPTCRQRIGVYK